MPVGGIARIRSLDLTDKVVERLEVASSELTKCQIVVGVNGLAYDWTEPFRVTNTAGIAVSSMKRNDHKCRPTYT